MDRIHITKRDGRVTDIEVDTYLGKAEPGSAYFPDAGGVNEGPMDIYIGRRVMHDGKVIGPVEPEDYAAIERLVK